MTPWSELLSQLMLGTHGSNAPTGDFTDFTPEQALLKQLALGGLTRRAGFMAKAVKALPKLDPAPAEVQAACSQQAMEWLSLVESNASTRELALDWFIFIHSRGKRVPLHSLTYVLELSNRHSSWAPYIVPVIGARGRWIVEKTDYYPHLQNKELWQQTDQPALKPTEIKSAHKNILEMHTRMMEELARE